MNKAKIIAVVVVIVLAAIVFFQNQQPVAFSFLFFAPVLVPKTMLIFGSAVIGSVLTLVFQFFWRRRGRSQKVEPVSSPPPPPVAGSS